METIHWLMETPVYWWFWTIHMEIFHEINHTLINGNPCFIWGQHLPNAQRNTPLGLLLSNLESWEAGSAGKPCAFRWEISSNIESSSNKWNTVLEIYGNALLGIFGNTFWEYMGIHLWENMGIHFWEYMEIHFLEYMGLCILLEVSKQNWKWFEQCSKSLSHSTILVGL